MASMASKGAAAAAAAAAAGRSLRFVRLPSVAVVVERRANTCCPSGLRHGLHTSPRSATDGVYAGLTEMRVQIPWVEALRRKRDEGHDPSVPGPKPSTAPNRKLEPKRMADSFHRVVLPLAQDPWLLDTYLNASGHIRLGTIFMDLDALAGVIAYKHTGDDVTTVTAAVDRITLQHPLHEICDLEMSGQVTYATGRSSMEISLQVAKAPPSSLEQKKKKPGDDSAVQPQQRWRRADDEDLLMTCAFTMVSLDPTTKRPVTVSPLAVDTAEEKRLFALGERNSREKKKLAQTALLKQAPNDKESDLIHAMWLKEREYHRMSGFFFAP
ncbi:MAG: hypothetical protein M1819_005033 [Sarea resinae]|nr:MAG: hypothetical protein M1819_005033 [Sarea resinae]